MRSRLLMSLAFLVAPLVAAAAAPPVPPASVGAPCIGLVLGGAAAATSGATRKARDMSRRERIGVGAPLRYCAASRRLARRATAQCPAPDRLRASEEAIRRLT